MRVGGGPAVWQGRALLAIAGALWLLSPRFTVEARMHTKDGTVELDGVHPRFKAAVERSPSFATSAPGHHQTTV